VIGDGEDGDDDDDPNPDSQGVLEDGNVGNSALPLFSGRGGRDESQRSGDGGDGGDGELHYELSGGGD
jgi:hypothetical protein